jgi:integrase
VIFSGDITMAVGMGLIQDRNGTWIVRKMVPKRLREPVARVLDNGKQQQTWLQKSTGTKLKDEAKRLAPAIMVEFAKTLTEAAGLLAERPLRTTLSQAEIDRLAEWHYANVLASDEAFTVDGVADDEALVRSVAAQLTEAGVDFDMPAPLDAQQPAYGLSNRQIVKRDADLAEWLPIMRAALARGDINMVSEAMAELLDRAQLNLDPNCAAYRKLGLAVLRADVRALDALERRSKGEPVDTPPIAQQEPIAALGTNAAPGLMAAFEGWQKERQRSSSTVAEYSYALRLFTELHGNIPVADVRKQHALQFRQALQDVPRARTKDQAKLTLPELVERHKAATKSPSHPQDPTLTSGTVNKLLGGVQALAKWAERNGLIPEDVRWSDPFAGMKLATSDEQGGGPFTAEELRRLFGSPVFTEGERPQGGQGETAFWLPLLALYTGCRRSELTRRKAADVTQIDGTWCLSIVSDKAAGQKLKTIGSARTLPIHPELVRRGFLDFVNSARSSKGGDWLFPAIATDKAANSFTAWFGRYLDRLGIGGGGRGLHSLRHNFKDALRAGGIAEDLNDALTGHSNRTVGRSYGARARHPSQRHKVILERYGLARLVEAVGKVEYRSVDLRLVRWR